ncbi:MAG: hypothetical protein H0W48_00005 [Methylibium sp.]|nr:hypothetical protein [Methylibium sp.]
MRFTVSGFAGANRAIHPKLLADNVGTESVNQRPGRGDLRGWKQLGASLATVAIGHKSIYRLGRDVASDTQYWLSWSTLVHAVRGFIAADTTERTYFSGDGAPKVTDNVMGIATPPYPTASRILGVPAPIIAPLLTQTTAGVGLDETRFYVYTYVTDRGEESAPSPLSAAIVCKPGAVITVSNMGTAGPTGNYGITLKRIYRTQTGSAATEFFFLREVAIGADSTTDDARALGETLPSSTWLIPPADLKGLHGLWNGMMAGISGRSVRYCEPFKPYAWPLTYETLLVDVTPVALGSFQQTLLVLTNGVPYAITGTSPDAMSEQRVELDQACVSAASVQSFGHGVVYASPDGLTYIGTNGPPRVLTAGLMQREDWQALVPATIVGAQYEGAYMGFYNDGTLKGFVIDPLNPSGLYFLDTGYAASYYDRLQDALYVLDGTAIKKWHDAVGAMTVRFRSRVVRLPAPCNMGYAEVTADAYPVTMRLYADGVLRFTKTVTSRDVFGMPSGYLADDFQVELEAAAGAAVQGAALAETVEELRQL